MPPTIPQDSYRHIWRLSWPIIFSNLTLPLTGAVDVAMMGHLPDPAYIGGVGLGVLVFNALYLAFGFLRMGTTGFAAQAVGAGDKSELAHILYRSVLIALILGGVLISLKTPILSYAQHFLSASARTEQLMAEYITIRLYDVPATLFNMVMLGWMFGQQRMKLCMLHLISVNMLNIGLNIWFVRGLGMDVDGVALSTVIAQYAGAVFFILILMFRRRTGFVLTPPEPDQLFHASQWKSFLSIARDLSIRTLMIWAVEAVLLSQSAKSGDVSLASVQLVLTLFNFIAFGLDGIAHAAEALTGQHIGSRNTKALALVISRSTRLSAAMALALTMGLFWFETFWITLLTSQAELTAVMEGLWIYVCLIPLASFLAFVMDGVFVGASQGRHMRNTTFISALICFVIIFSLPGWAEESLLLGFLVYLILRGVLLWQALPAVLSRANP